MCFRRGRLFGQPPFLPASLIFFGSRALAAPRPRAPLIDAAAAMTISSGMPALHDGHFMCSSRFSWLSIQSYSRPSRTIFYRRARRGYGAAFLRRVRSCRDYRAEAYGCVRRESYRAFLARGHHCRLVLDRPLGRHGFRSRPYCLCIVPFALWRRRHETEF